MTNPTSNFGWQMPESTDLVTNLPADFEVFGQAVDTDFADLLGGTTGQVLSKTSNTDLDFTWTTSSGGMTNPMTTTGDTIYSSSGSTPARLGIGSASQVLTVVGGIPAWSSPTSSGALTKITSGSFSASSSVVVDNCFSNTYTKYMLIWRAYASSSGADLQLQFRYAGGNTQTSSYYGAGRSQDRNNTVVNYGNTGSNQGTITNYLEAGADYFATGYLYFDGVGNASESPQFFGSGFSADSQGMIAYSTWLDTMRVYTGFLLKPSTGNMTGTYAVYAYTN